MFIANKNTAEGIWENIKSDTIFHEFSTPVILDNTP